MGWEEDLFAYLDDLEGQAAALYDAERAPELADRSRAEYQQVTLASRLMASVDREVTLDLLGVGAVSGGAHPRRHRLVPAPGPRTGLGGPPRRGRRCARRVRPGAARASAWPSVARLGVTAALRRLADGAEPCSLHLLDGRRYDGVLLRVGADFVEVATGEAGRVVLVAFSQVAAVQSRR